MKVPQSLVGINHTYKICTGMIGPKERIPNLEPWDGNVRLWRVFATQPFGF